MRRRKALYPCALVIPVKEVRLQVVRLLEEPPPALAGEMIRRGEFVREAPDGPWLKRVRTAGDVAEIVRRTDPRDEREHFWAFFLDGKNRIEGLYEGSVGTLTSSLVHPRDVLRPAVVAGAAAVVVAHNHPSGDPTPSPEDREVTRRLVSAGEILGIRVLDHVVIGEHAHFSFLEKAEL